MNNINKFKVLNVIVIIIIINNDYEAYYLQQHGNYIKQVTKQ